MEQKFILMDEAIVPEIYIKVLKAKELIQRGEAKGITEAVKKAGISRSAFYKYQKHIFKFSEMDGAKKATLSLLLGHQRGRLAEILNHISKAGGSILTIHQNIPINEMASLTITMDIARLEQEVETLVEGISQIPEVLKVELISVGY